MTKKDGLRRYGCWAGNPAGSIEDVTRCVQSVGWNERASVGRQCDKKRGHGEGGLYCRQHALKHPAEGDVKYMVYAVNDMAFPPRLQQAQVVSESEHFLTLRDSPLAFDCKSKLSVLVADRTPAAAWRRYAGVQEVKAKHLAAEARRCEELREEALRQAAAADHADAE